MLYLKKLFMILLISTGSLALNGCVSIFDAGSVMIMVLSGGLHS